MRIYVASSWRNLAQPGVVTMLRREGHEVYDFRHPPHGNGGFMWADIDPNWQQWTARQYRTALSSPVADDGYRSDMDAMQWAEACVLVLPCGRSAHLEAGWFAGKGKPVFVLTQDGEEPELMAKMCTAICVDWFELLDALDQHAPVATLASCAPAINAGAVLTDKYGPTEHEARRKGNTKMLDTIAKLRDRNSSSEEPKP